MFYIELSSAMVSKVAIRKLGRKFGKKWQFENSDFSEISEPRKIFSEFSSSEFSNIPYASDENSERKPRKITFRGFRDFRGFRVFDLALRPGRKRGNLGK